MKHGGHGEGVGAIVSEGATYWVDQGGGEDCALTHFKVSHKDTKGTKEGMKRGAIVSERAIAEGVIGLVVG